MGDKLKTPKEMAKKEVNKKLAKAIAKKVLEKKKLQAKIIKLDKQITKIEKGELIPDDEGNTPESDDDEDDESSDSSTHISFILDESGSMSGSSAVKDFNEYLDTMKKEKGSVTMTLTKFNSERVNIVFKNKRVKDIASMKDEEFRPDALTPLFDAVGKTINSIPLESKRKNLFVIITDGMENHSKEFTKENIQALIKEREAKGWVFSYLGVGKDAWGGNRMMGIADSHSMNSSRAGMGASVMCFASASSNYHRSSGGQSSFKLSK